MFLCSRDGGCGTMTWRDLRFWIPTPTIVITIATSYYQWFELVIGHLWTDTGAMALYRELSPNKNEYWHWHCLYQVHYEMHPEQLSIGNMLEMFTLSMISSLQLIYTTTLLWSAVCVELCSRVMGTTIWSTCKTSVLRSVHIPLLSLCSTVNSSAWITVCALTAMWYCHVHLS